MHDVAVVRYEKPLESLRKAVNLAGGLGAITGDSKVCIKPNFCQWFDGVNFPKYGVLTTARLIEDMVILLKEQGADDIYIVEGAVEIEKKRESTIEQVVRGMGLNLLTERYGVAIKDALRGSFTRVTAGDVTLSVNEDILAADFIINMPVLKTHSQTVVSLGIKNLKGSLNIASRKKCHTPKKGVDLDYHLARLPELLPTYLTVIDGIYSLERGPLITGRAHRSNIIVASKDVISADKVGATILGIDPQTVPYINSAAGYNGRPTDLSDIRIKGGVDISSALKPHEWEFVQNESGELPLFFERAGIKGLTYPQADKSMCTYCADFIYYIIQGILTSKNKDNPFDDMEVLHGKALEPAEGHKHTLLVGQCQVKKNRNNPRINHCVEIKGCPPSKKELLDAYAELGIELPGDFLKRMEKISGTFMKKYKNNPDFDESFYRLQ
jgi:uncharacterized protein (DUF362 family)